MRNGTQEELDAAKEDATNIPKNAAFKVKSQKNGVFFNIGEIVTRLDKISDFEDSHSCVAMWLPDGSQCCYFTSDNLEPI